MIGDENLHRCREPPSEAAVYNLKTEDEKHDKFRADSRTELTVEVGESSDPQQEKKIEHSSLELPVDFSKEDVAKVNLFSQNCTYNYHSLKFPVDFELIVQK